MEANNLSRHSTQSVVLQSVRAAIASCEKLESDFRNKGDYCHNNIGEKTYEDRERMDKFLLDAADEMRKIRRCMEFLATVSSRQNPRNCDVGTAGEQAKRMDAYCASHGERIGCSWRCDNCQLCSIERCELAWA